MIQDSARIKGTEDATHADRIARSVVSQIHAAGGGHFGGALSSVDILLVLLRDIVDLRGDVGQRDHFVLSKGHAAAALYCVMIELGMMPENAMDGFGRDPGALGGHPEAGQPHVEVATGSLGQGLSVALGLAMVLRERGRRAFVLLGDGECQEGQVWEAAMLAARLGVENLTAVVDCNDLQEYGFRDAGRPTIPVLDLAAKWEAFGWTVIHVDGHDEAALRTSLRQRRRGPTVVLAHTRKGRNVALFLKDPDRAHCTELSDSEYRGIVA